MWMEDGWGHRESQEVTEVTGVGTVRGDRRLWPWAAFRAGRERAWAGVGRALVASAAAEEDG